jgi:hypothetical protein
MAPVPGSGRRRDTILGRLQRLLGRREDGERPASDAAGEARARWPHLVRGWLDPDMPFAGMKTTIDRSDAEDALRIVAAASDGRVGDAEVAEVLDALAQTEGAGARAFRFGKPRSFGQLWVGLSLAPPLAVKVFVLGAQDFVAALEERLSLAGFAGAAKRAELDRLRSFFLAAWDWQWTAAPFAGELRRSKPKDFDPASASQSMQRVLSNPATPLLEILRGLRRRTRDLLEETRGLAQAELEAADAYLASRGAATMTEMRRSYLSELSDHAAPP